MIVRHEDDVLAFAWAFGAFIDKRCGRRDGGEREQSEEDVFHAVEESGRGKMKEKA